MEDSNKNPSTNKFTTIKAILKQTYPKQCKNCKKEIKGCSCGK